MSYQKKRHKLIGKFLGQESHNAWRSSATARIRLIVVSEKGSTKVYRSYPAIPAIGRSSSLIWDEWCFCVRICLCYLMPSRSCD